MNHIQKAQARLENVLTLLNQMDVEIDKIMQLVCEDVSFETAVLQAGCEEIRNRSADIAVNVKRMAELTEWFQ